MLLNVIDVHFCQFKIPSGIEHHKLTLLQDISYFWKHVLLLS
jgi:hypothetical protein